MPMCLSFSCDRELAELNSEAQVDRELGPKKRSPGKFVFHQLPPHHIRKHKTVPASHD